MKKILFLTILISLLQTQLFAQTKRSYNEQEIQEVLDIVCLSSNFCITFNNVQPDTEKGVYKASMDVLYYEGLRNLNTADLTFMESPCSKEVLVSTDAENKAINIKLVEPENNITGITITSDKLAINRNDNNGQNNNLCVYLDKGKSVLKDL